MEKTSYWRLIGEIERIVKDRVPASHPAGWAEDQVVAGLLSTLAAELDDTTVTGFRETHGVRLSAFRRKGKRETANADLSLLARVTRRDGSTLEGAAFIETKLKQDRKRTFDSFRLPELRRFFRGSPFSQVLFLDYEDITSYSSNRSVQFPPLEYSPWRGGVPVTPYTYAVVIPTSIVIAQHLNDTSIYGFSVPFSYQLVYRYFHGFDLDLSEQALLAARGQSTKKGLSEFLVCLTVTEEGADIAPAPDLDRAVWAPLEA